MLVMQAGAVGSISDRLSRRADLVLPGSLAGAGSPAPDETQRKEYFRALLEHDAGVMLERYGIDLTAEELDAFEPLREDYEVDFYLRRLRPATEPATLRPPVAGAPTISATSKNRRLAQLHRLVESGDYFSDEAMRERAPLLHYHYVAQYRPAAPRNSKSLAESMLRGFDEADTLEKLSEQREQESMVEEEEESEEGEAMAEDRRAEVPQPTAARGGTPPAAPHPLVQLPPGAPQSASAALATAAAAAIRQDEAAMAHLESQMRATGSVQPPGDGGAIGLPGKGTLERDAGAEPVEAGGDADVGGAAVGEEGAAAGPSYVCIPEEERLELEGDFLELMQAHFLSGEDEGVDYALIDADVSLDDDFARERQQDAEDAYFDDV